MIEVTFMVHMENVAMLQRLEDGTIIWISNQKTYRLEKDTWIEIDPHTLKIDFFKTTPLSQVEIEELAKTTFLKDK